MESLLAALPSILSAAITGIVTYMATQSSNKLTMTDKEYAQLDKQRQYVIDLQKETTEQNVKELERLRAVIVDLQNKLDIADAAEEDCQRKLMQSNFRIRELEKQLEVIDLEYNIKCRLL